MFTKAINLILFAILLLFLMDISSTLEIKWQALKTSVYFGVIYVPFFVLFWNILMIKKWGGKLISLIVPIIAIVVVYNISYLYIMLHDSTWKTQTTIYENRYSNSRKIEFQMKDVGALGYRKRTVDVTYLTNWFMTIELFDEKNIDQTQWNRIDENTNELDIVY